jgi:hypothetical protein
MRTFQLTIVFILGLSLNCIADYRPSKLYYMVLTADKILNAEIVKIDKTFFYVVSVDSSTSKKELYKVKKFADWPCAARYDTYQVGQRMLLLLKKEKDYYYIQSAGGEGEIPIIKDSVSIPFECLAYPDNWKIGYGVRSDSISKYECSVGRKSFYGLHVSLTDLISSIDRLQTNFKIRSKDSIDCSDFIEKQSFENTIDLNSHRLFYLLCMDFYEQKKKYCH